MTLIAATAVFAFVFILLLVGSFREPDISVLADPKWIDEMGESR